MSTPDNTTASDLWTALLAVQAEAPTIQRDAVNPHFKSSYASLGAVHDAVLPLLNKHGLVWVTKPSYDERGEPTLVYRLVHVETGQLEGGEMQLAPQKRDPQGLGSAITYARRYALVSMLSLVTEEDDDGNAASRPQNGSAQVSRPTARPAQGTEKIATAKQRGLINVRASEKDITPYTLANIVKVAVGQPPHEWDSMSAAESWLQRNLDRLPARLVDPVLEGIANAEPETVDA